jgi:hypothetical protein
MATEKPANAVLLSLSYENGDSALLRLCHEACRLSLLYVAGQF